MLKCVGLFVFIFNMNMYFLYNLDKIYKCILNIYEIVICVIFVLEWESS